MAWTIEFDQSTVKDLKRISKPEQKRILKHLTQKVANLDNPRSIGKALTGSFSGLWCYRIGDYRALCKIEDEVITILVIAIKHRKNAYDYHS